MKKRNRMVALMLAAVMSMSLAACGKSGNDSQPTGQDAGVEADADADAAAESASEEAEAPEEETEDPFAAAQENMTSVTSLDAKTVMEMDMVVSADGQEQSVESVTTMDMSCFYEPLRMRMEMTVDAGEAGSVSTTLYAETDESGTCTAYMNDGTGWQSQTVSAADLDQYDFSTDMNLYLTGDYGFEEARTEAVDGANAYKYTGAITGDEMKELMLASGAMNSVSQLGLDTTQVDSMLDGLGDLAINLWIDEATLYPVKYEIDMTDAMNTLMTNMVEAMGEQGEGVSMSIPKMTMSMTCSNYNAATDFTVPEEAKAE